jgi:hypothetical protein
MLKKHKLIKCFYNIIQVGKYVMYSRSHEKKGTVSVIKVKYLHKFSFFSSYSKHSYNHNRNIQHDTR